MNGWECGERQDDGEEKEEGPEVMEVWLEGGRQRGRGCSVV